VLRETGLETRSTLGIDDARIGGKLTIPTQREDANGREFDASRNQADSAPGCAESAGVVDAGEYVISCQDRVSNNDIIDRVAGAEVGKDRFDGDACPCDDGTTVADFGIDFDPGFHTDGAVFEVKIVDLKKG
jgi:hypothetical protein